MNKPTFVVAGLVAVAVIILLLQETGVVSLQDLLRRGPAPVSDNHGGGQVGAAAGITVDGEAGAGGNGGEARGGEGAAVSFEHISNLIANAEAGQRRSVLGNKEQFRELVNQESRNQSLLAAARANNLDKEASVRFLMDRAANNMIREIYMRRLIENNLAEDFPSEEQVRKYYENNREKFRLGDRIHLWQVFLPVTDDMDEKQKENTRKQAADIAADIRSGKLAFSRAALEASGHPPSRNNGGYMGLVKVDELRPALAEPILELEEGRISDPIDTEEGIHIIRKGETVPGRDVALDEVREQVRELLRNQAVSRLREAIFAKAEETYPVDVPNNRVEEWRLRLRTDTPAARNGGDDS